MRQAEHASSEDGRIAETMRWFDIGPYSIRFADTNEHITYVLLNKIGQLEAIYGI